MRYTGNRFNLAIIVALAMILPVGAAAQSKSREERRAEANSPIFLCRAP